MAAPGRIATAATLCAAVLAPCSAFALDKATACVGCHERQRQPASAGHPVGVPIAGQVSGQAAGLPLERGRLVCTTCHVGHGEAGYRAADGNFFLRFPVPDLCARCHRGSGGLWDEPHAQYADTVHGGRLFAGLPPAGEDASEPGLDPASRRCLACHGDVPLAPDFAATAPRIAVRHTHPLVEYAAATAETPDGLRAPRNVGVGARLVDGRVSCASCHRVYALSRGVIPVASRRELCLSCHDLGPALPDRLLARTRREAAPGAAPPATLARR